MKSITCIMLADGRPEMVRRAVASFHAQEYREKRLLIWNTGGREDFRELEGEDVAVAYSPDPGPVGTLRNRANGCALDLFPSDAEVLAHWDSDDWSHPRRLTEQMELLENTQADVIGYREGLFFDATVARREMVDDVVCTVDDEGRRVMTRRARRFDPLQNLAGEAWIYRALNPKFALGASMLYPAATWKRVPFPALNVGEDHFWLMSGRLRVHAVPSTWSWRGLPNHEPRIIFSIHGRNTSSAIIPDAVEWKREPLFDGYCLERMGNNAA